MATPLHAEEQTIWELPPLILHPFNERVPPSALLDNSRAALMLAGLIPAEANQDELHRRLLVGRYSEVRMLYFLGKDVFRWLDQCVEWAERSGEFPEQNIRPQSFATLIASTPPDRVRDKLVRWGVADSASIFSRAIALNVVFSQPPAFETLSEDFLGNYHRYCDALYRTFLAMGPFMALSPSCFLFELYASGEYSKLLESRWSGEEPAG